MDRTSRIQYEEVYYHRVSSRIGRVEIYIGFVPNLIH